MRFLPPESAGIFERAIKLLNGQDTITIDARNGVFMPLVIERIKDGVFAFVQTEEDAPGLLFGLEMTFLRVPDSAGRIRVYPLTYETFYGTEYLERGKPAYFQTDCVIVAARVENWAFRVVNEDMLHDLCNYANGWLNMLSKRQKF